MSVLFLILFSALALAACAQGFDPDAHGYTVLVVYDANGGRYSNADTEGVKRCKYLPAVNIMRPGGQNGENKQFPQPTREDMHVRAWYPAELNADGNPVKNADGSYVLAAEPWDFGSDVLPDDPDARLYLVAVWSMNYSFTVDVGEEARAAGVENIVSTDYDTAGPVSVPGFPPEWSGHTFHYYRTEDGKRLSTAADWAEITVSDETPDVTVYVEWLTGEWKIVTGADDLREMDATTNYYIDDDIDFGKYDGDGNLISNGTWNPVRYYSGEFRGNGHTISNFVCDFRQSGKTERNGGLFSFRSSGFIRDVNFVNGRVNVNYNIDNPAGFNAGFLAGDVSQAKLEKFAGLSFRGCTLAVSLAGAVSDAEVLTGTGNHAGIFGKIGETQVFVPAEGSETVAVVRL